MTHDGTMAANPAGFTSAAHESARTLTRSTGQSADLDSCVRRHARLLFKVAYGVLRNSHDAEDVVQETFLRAHCAGLREVQDTKAWLAIIAFRIAIDRMRVPKAEDLAGFDPASPHPTAEHTAIHRQQVERLQRLIASLPEDLRYPLVLAAVEELTSRQIGEMLGISESSVRGRIMRARETLRKKMAAVENTTA
jgi:RNA polymerase sigma-70 factor (ECF subfamily)